jgi:hypothetical protein
MDAINDPHPSLDSPTSPTNSFTEINITLCTHIPIVYD